MSRDGIAFVRGLRGAPKVGQSVGSQVCSRQAAARLGCQRGQPQLRLPERQPQAQSFVNEGAVGIEQAVIVAFLERLYQ